MSNIRAITVDSLPETFTLALTDVFVSETASGTRTVDYQTLQDAFYVAFSALSGGPPFVDIATYTSVMYATYSTNIHSGAYDAGTFITPANHIIEVRSGSSNPPTGSFSQLYSHTPITSSSDIIDYTWTPSVGNLYYQFRAYANYGTQGVKYSPNSSVIRVLLNTSPTVSVSIDQTLIYSGSTVTMHSTTSDVNSYNVPLAHGFEVRYSSSVNPPTGTFSQIYAVSSAVSPSDTINYTWTPILGVGYYQFRAFATYNSPWGRVYSSNSTVLQVLAPTTPPPTTPPPTTPPPTTPPPTTPPPTTPDPNSYLLLQDGTFLLLQDGSRIILQ